MQDEVSRILLVNDSEADRTALEEALARAGYVNVTPAASAREAYAVLGLEGDGAQPPSPPPVDLILMNMEMPGVSGIEACRRIREADRLRDIPIIAVTDRRDLACLAEAFQAGAMDFIAHPIVQVALEARVKSALALKRERDRRRAREKELLSMTAELARANQKLRRMSSLDGLTGAPNRRYFDDALETEWRRALRQGQPLALVMIDIDFFKNYNDRYGHLAGDECLRRTAEAMGGRLRRAGDLLARYGGEEFAALLPDTKLKGALALAESCRRAVEELAVVHEDSLAAPVVTVSLGAAAMIPDEGQTPQDLIQAADQALYRAKDGGRNRVEAAETISVLEASEV